MKAYKIALPLLAATTLVCTSVGVANAQEDPADCGAATIALTSAQSEHAKAVKADEKLANAEKRRDDRDDARDRVTETRKKLSNDTFGDASKIALPSNVNEAKTKRSDLRAAIALPEPPAGHSDADLEREVERLDRYIKAENDLDDAQKKVDRNQSVGDARKDADKTDAAELKTALDEAQDDVNRLCGGVTTTPSPTPEPAPSVDLDCGDFPLADGRTAQQVLDSTPGEDPNGLDADLDRVACEPGQDTASDGSDLADNAADVSSDEVVVPNGGVNTGGGPA